MLKGCVIPVADDKYTILYKNNSETASDVKYKEKYEKAKGHYVPVLDPPQILHAKPVRALASESKYKEEGKKAMQSSSFSIVLRLVTPPTAGTSISSSAGNCTSRSLRKRRESRCLTR
ncbi:uncharacterized protein FYW49_016941 [Xenentodon cancila]